MKKARRVMLAILTVFFLILLSPLENMPFLKVNSTENWSCLPI